MFIVNRVTLGRVWGNHLTLAKLTVTYRDRFESPEMGPMALCRSPLKGQYSLLIEIQSSKCFMGGVEIRNLAYRLQQPNSDLTNFLRITQYY